MTSESVPVLGADYNAERFLRTIHTGSDAGCPTCGLLGIIDAERAASAARIAELEARYMALHRAVTTVLAGSTRLRDAILRAADPEEAHRG